MKVDPKELLHIAAADAPRFDMYGPIHKALRAFMSDTLLAVGRMDCDDRLDVAQTTERVLQLMDACASHLRHENEFIHKAIEARSPGASEAIAHDHEDHVRHIARLAELVRMVREAEGAERGRLAHALYHGLALFTAENWQHMHVEETAHNAVLRARYTDAELLAIHDALVASIPPHEMMVVARWMVPFMNPAERAAMLTGVRAKAPAPAFEAILATVRPHMTETEWAKLVKALA